MADRGAGRVVGGRVGRMVAVAFALVASLFAGAVNDGTVSAAADEHPEFILIPADLEHMLKQIQIAEAHAAGGQLLCAQPTDTSGKCVPDPMLPLGLRTVDGTFNNLEFNPLEYGSAHHPFPRRLTPVWRDGSAAPDQAPPNPPGATDVCADPSTTCYSQYEGFVYDPEPRTISNLIVDQTINNPAALAAADAHADAAIDPVTGQNVLIDPATGNIELPNTAPDEELSAPFNAWFTFFGQFFDHGLDLVSKGGNGSVVIPLNCPDDPLCAVTPPQMQFMLLSRATQQPGPDGDIGTDDDIREHNNLTTPFVDQNQTYTSHPSHQFFLREYVPSNGPGSAPVATGRLLEGANGGLATWNDIKTQAREVLGIALGLEPGTTPSAGNSDYPDVLDVPLILTDQYGNFIPDAAGYPQLVTDSGTVSANPNAPISTANAMRTGHAFLDDIAHGASLDPEDLSGYDNVLLGEHFITGDGRGNENIGLTAVHHVFHSEHNRMAEWVTDLLENPQHELYTSGMFEYDPELLNVFRGANNNYQEKMGEPLPEGPEADDWSYEERIFQVAKFATEMQYQHLVFEEFARRIQPEIDAIVLNENSYDSTINPSIVAEFAHVVYRFGHSMLTETIERDLNVDVNGDGVIDANDVSDPSLLSAFLNPTAFHCPVAPEPVDPTDPAGLSQCPDGVTLLTPDQAAGAIVNGTTNQRANQIDEFVISTLRNNLLGLPLDLPAINMARARDAGVPSLQAARREFFDQSGDPQLRPYTSWADFDLNLKNGNLFGRGERSETLVNFVAAYGTHPTILAETSIVGKRQAASLLVNGPQVPDFVTRTSGSDRFATAAALSAENFQPGVPVVYIANGLNYPDALAGGSAAAAGAGPVLLVRNNDIPGATANELARLQPQRIVVLGGEGVVTSQVFNSLQTYTQGTVTRQFGSDRYITAAALSASLFAANAEVVYVVSGLNFPDALPAAALAARDRAPLLLVRENDIPTATQAELNRLNPNRIVLIGGTGVVSTNVQNALQGFAGAGGVTRVSGADRYDTSAMISALNYDPATTDMVFVTTGDNYPDGLTAAAVAGLKGAPLLLVPSNLPIPQSVIDEINRLTLLRAPAGVRILGGPNVINATQQAQLDGLAPFVFVPEDRMDFMNSTGAWAPQNGLTTTGLEGIDLWVGGLAEVLDPFGGMLGTTFNHVFEEQLENLQFGDRFYYLFRNQGNQLFAGLENNSFASLVRRNTDAVHIPADIFAIQDPYFELENLPTPMPEGLIEQTDGCIRWDGDEHIEIHGTPAPDCIIGGQGDDSLWGYAGNDRIEGGSGNDTVIAGDGDDIVTDTFGDDNLKGGWGNDALHTGPGVDDLVTASHGNDFISLGLDTIKTVFAGTGNDIILGGTGRDNVFGGEGEDWIETGPHADLLLGDNANQFQSDPNGGADILKGGAGSDDSDSDGGDDIMVGNAGGTDRHEGMMGFDWVTYYGETAPVDVDLRFTILQRPDIQAIRDRFDLLEGMSGGSGNDVLRGTGVEVDDIPDPQKPYHALTQAGMDRIGGLEALLNPPDHANNYALRFMDTPQPDTDGLANPIFGGPGSDIIEGRGGNDFLDGDMILRVQLEADGQRYDSAAALEAMVFAGALNPGDISIVREVVDLDADGSYDTAFYSQGVADYTIRDLGDSNDDGVHYYEVAHTVVDEFEESEGFDVIRNFEEIRFADGCLVVENGVDPAEWDPCLPGATLTLSTQSPVEDQPITATLNLDDGVELLTGSIVHFTWQTGEAGRGFEPSPNDAPETVPEMTTNTFTPGDEDTGDGDDPALLRVIVNFTDSEGNNRFVGAITANGVENVQDEGVVTVPETVANGGVITATLTDGDGLDTATPNYQWQRSTDGGTTFTNIPGTGTSASYLTLPTDAGALIRVVVEYTDNFGFAETVTSANVSVT